MKGSFGIMLIALGVFIAIMGGYILNAETVQTCSTEWDYMTEVSGAFKGDRSDMDVEYSPPSNITGWSYEKGYNNGWISGVEIPKFSNRANLYGAYYGAKGFSNYSLDVLSLTPNGNEPLQRFSVSADGGEAIEADQTGGFGWNNGDVLTYMEHEGAHFGPFGAPLSAILKAIPGLYDYPSVVLTAEDSADGFPGFADVEIVDRSPMNSLPDRYLNAFVTEIVYTNISSEVRVDLEGNSAIIDGAKVPVESVVFVWGKAKYGSEAGVTQASISVIAETGVERVFLDPALGVIARSGVYETQQIVYTEHDSFHPSLEISVDPASYQEAQLGGTVKVKLYGSMSFRTLFSWSMTGIGDVRSDWDIEINGQTIERSLSEGSASLVFVLDQDTEGTVYLDGQTVGTISGLDIITEFKVDSLDGMGNNSDAIQYTVTADDGSSRIETGIGEKTISAKYRTKQQTPTIHEYRSSHWNNGQQNSSVTMVFSILTIPDIPLYIELDVTGPSSTVGPEMYVLYKPADGWSILVDTESIDIGRWPAIEVRIAIDGVTATPLGSFTSFTDYSRIGVPSSLEYPMTNGGTIENIEVWGYENFALQVVSTTARIAEGGLYLQDATLDMTEAFPELFAYTLKVGSAAHVGGSITFSSGSSTATIAVDGDRALIGREWVPLNGLSFRWYSSSGPSASIGSTVYDPSIYDRGQVYSAGILYAQPSSGSMVEIMSAPDGVTMTLDGVWAPTVSLYDGKNIASERTDLADFTKGEFRWDKNDFIICMMAVSILGGLVGSYFGKATGLDWIVIFGTIGILWMIL